MSGQKSNKVQPRKKLDPKTPSGKLALDVLDWIIGDDWESLPSAVRERIERAPSEFVSETIQRGRGKQENKVEYTRWIDRISHSVVAGERPLTLLLEFMSDIESLIQTAKSDVIFGILIEELIDDSSRKRFTVLRAVGASIDKAHWREFNNHLLGFENNTFLKESVQTIGDVEVRLARYVENYDGELNGLVRTSLKKSQRHGFEFSEVQDSFWLSRIALRSEQAQAPQRSIILAYENIGDDVWPQCPHCASEEWRVLFFLRIAYAQLDYRIRDLPRYVQGQRSYWIRELAPSVLAHEAVAQTSIISDSAVQATDLLLKYVQTMPSALIEVKPTAIMLKNVMESAKNLNRTFSTYLNLQRNSRVERFQLGQIFEEAWELCRHRLNGIEVGLDRQTHATQLQTDRSLLTLVLTNLMANGARAINEENTTLSAVIAEKRIAFHAEPQSENIMRLLFFNSGPPIPPEQRGRIFQQGFSTHSDGHGQGLFVSRMICQHLGGNLVLDDPKRYDENMNVAFMITLKSNLEITTGEKT